MNGQISDSELELMKIVWESGGTVLYAEIMETLSETGNEWKKNTVLTLLSRLVEKGYLSINKVGRRNEYKAQVTEADYLAGQNKAFLHRLYEGDAKGLVTALISQDFLSKEDMGELADYWKEQSNRHE